MSAGENRAKTIFLNALEVASETERMKFVVAQCGQDEGLRREVERLLVHNKEISQFLESPAPNDVDLAPTADPEPTEAPGKQIGPYKLLQVMGEGGMGIVYMAEQDVPVKRRVALKVIKPGMDSRAVIARFEAERQALALMDHPNIAKVLDAGTTENGRPFFVMELVKGVPITQYCDEQHLTPQERLALFVPICQAADHAHHKGIVHRDIKPSNVLIAEYDNNPVPKIIDFGIAKAISQQLTEKTMVTQYGQVVGTIEYMSPEQAGFNQLDVDTRSDVYSLGVLLYELLTGETPFSKRRLRLAAFDEMMKIIREEEPPAPSMKLGTNDALPSIAANRQVEPRKLQQMMRGELDCIIMKAMEKDRGRRYDNANTLAKDVESFLNGDAISARPPTLGFRLRRFARQKKTSLFVATLLLLVVVLGSMIVFLLSGPGNDNSTTAGNGTTNSGTTDKTKRGKKRPAGTGQQGGDNGNKDQNEKKNERSDKQQRNTKRVRVDRVPQIKEKGVLTVSQDPDMDGQYRTIKQALEQAKAGQTIRVIDRGRYTERILFGDKTAHSNITLEATNGATLAAEGKMGLIIARAANVTVRGFRIELEKIAADGAAIVVGLHSPGAILEDLHFKSDGTLLNVGVRIEQLGLQDTDDPVLIQDCEFDGLAIGVAVFGGAPCRRCVIRRNRFSGVNSIGITLSRHVENCQVVANSFDRMLNGIQLKSIAPGSRRILVANNSLRQCERSIAIWDDKPNGKLVRITNNLILGSAGADMVFVDGQLGRPMPAGPNDGKLVHKAWTLSHNWREVKTPTGKSLYDKSWIAPSQTSTRADKIDVSSLTRGDSDYLRPPADSDLAKKGAGRVEPSLPMYVGAFAPAGVTPWDWNRTWLAPPGTGSLLTVSKDPKDGGEYRTIRAALKAATPWAAIRVLDSSEYDETIHLHNSKQHLGIMLIAEQGATITNLTISNVSYFVVRGFRVRGKMDASTNLIVVSGQVEGGLLDSLTCQSEQRQRAIEIQQTSLTAKQQPFVIRNCLIRCGAGIRISGLPGSPTRHVCIRQNRIECLKEGINIAGLISGVQCVGNIIRGCKFVGIELQELAPKSQNILLANNTIFECKVGLQVVDRQPFQEFVAGQVELANNLFFAFSTADLISLRATRAVPGLSPVDGTQIMKLWGFRSNWRDFSGSSASSSLPRDKRNRGSSDWKFVSRESNHLQYMQPVKDSELATGGAGGSLPVYAGAVAPNGVRPWNWDVTWRSHSRRSLKTSLSK